MGATAATDSATAPDGSEDSAGEDGLDRSSVLVAAVLVLGGLMVVLDTTIINVAVGYLAQAMDASLPVMQWVITGYTLALASVMPITAWAIGRLGGKRAYLIALALFVAGSLAAGLAWDVASLIAFRVLQGLGGGMIMPVAMTLALRAVPQGQRGRIMGILGIPVLVGPAIGPTLGGWLLDALSWRWIFFINLPIGLVAIAAVVLTLRNDPPNPTHKLDVVGLALLSPGLAALIYGLAATGNQGRLTVMTLTAILVGAVLVLAFVRRAVRTDHPLVELRLLRLPAMATGAGILVLFAAAYFGSMFLAPLYYQIVRGHSAFGSGLLMLPQALATGVTMQVAARLIDRIAPLRVIGTGIGLAVIGFGAFGLGVVESAQLWVLLVALGVAGTGVGATLMPTITTATRWLTQEQLPSGTTLLNVVQQTAVSFGTAATSVVLGAGLSARLPGLVQEGAGDLYQLPRRAVDAAIPRLAAAFGTSFWLPVALMTVALVFAVVLLRRLPRRDGDREPG